MTKQQIVNSLKGIECSTFEVEKAFQAASQKNNFNSKFGKTSQYWSNSQWGKVAREVKKEM